MACLVTKSIVIISIFLSVSEAARILGIFPHPIHSHQVVFRSLTTELARRGHELIVFTTDLLNDPSLQNYTEVDLNYFYNYITINFYEKKHSGIWSVLHDVYVGIEKITDEVLSHPTMQKLISPNSTEKFDLIIVQCLYYDAFYALSSRFNAPLIGISSLPLIAMHHYIFGNPLLPAYSPDIFSGYNDDMNLWERFVNIYYYLRQVYEYEYITTPIQDRLIKKYFGDNIPSVRQLTSNISLLLVNSHPFFVYSRPNVPAIREIGGCHVTREKKYLPQDLDKMLNDTDQGYIYFSLGSNVKSNTLPVERRNMLLRTFAKLPYKVLWKFESDDLPNKSSNIVIRKWLPQQEILAHANVRLFIYQGGLQSTEEAIENGVPVIGLPIIVDQIYNVRIMQYHKVGKMLDIANLNEEEFRETILEVITNPSYKKNILKLRELLYDLPYHPNDNAVWWVEHVIRHKGAPHLRNKSRDMPWYRLYLLDIMAIVLVTIVLIIRIIMVIKRYVFNFIKWLALQIRLKLICKKASIKKQE